MDSSDDTENPGQIERFRLNVPIFRTLSVIVTIVGTAGYAGYNFSNTMVGLDLRLSDIKVSINNLVAELRTKVGNEDFDRTREMDCMRAELVNRAIGWKCPFSDAVMARRPHVPPTGTTHQ